MVQRAKWLSNQLWVVGAIVLVLRLVPLDAQTVDVAGTWRLTVETDAGGTTTPSVALEQNGSELAGHYSSDTLGDAEVTGTVNGNQVRFSFEAEVQGFVLDVTYAGTFQEDGTLTGTISLSELGEGTFTGTRR